MYTGLTINHPLLPSSFVYFCVVVIERMSVVRWRMSARVSAVVIAWVSVRGCQ